jgi:hypothetical protein
MSRRAIDQVRGGMAELVAQALELRRRLGERLREGLPCSFAQRRRECVDLPGCRWALRAHDSMEAEIASGFVPTL